MSSRRLITVVVLVAWVSLGPIAMAFGSCAGMGAMCEGPCGTTSCVVRMQTAMAAATPVADLQVQFSDRLATVTLKVPDPPPKSAPLVA